MSDDDQKGLPARRRTIDQGPGTELVPGRGGNSGLPNIIERMRSYGQRKLYDAKADEVRAHTGLTQALAENTKSAQALERTLIESGEWNEAVERKRIQTQYALEDMDLDAALEQRRREMELQRHELANEVEQRAHELEMARRRRAAELNPPPPTQKPRREPPDFAQRVRDILKYGAVGEHTRQAKEEVEKYVASRGGEENLTDEEREHIDMAYQEAQRADLSKGKG